MGLGFSVRLNQNGLLEVANVEKKSPALYGGLKMNDLILKVNGINLAECGENVDPLAVVKKESMYGVLRFEVIDLVNYNVQKFKIHPT